MMTARRTPAACHVPRAAAPTRTVIAAAQLAADPLLPLMTPPEGSDEHGAGGSANAHPPVPATVPGRSRQIQATPAGS
jgi:hypothetical protein